MILLLGLIGIPIAYLVILGTLLARRSLRGLGISLLFFALAAGSALWGIFQSRSSTAGIGIIGIPLIGALSGLLGLAFGRWRSSTEPNRRVAAFLGLAGAVLLVAFNVREATQTVTKNQVRDETQAAHTAEIARHRELIAAGLGENPDRQRVWIDSSIRSRMSDRAFLIAALENDSVSPGILDTLADSNDLGIALMAVRNPNASGETLARVYRRHSYPNYFFQALAGNPKTPPEIIRELYTKPRTITGLDGWFARNPATPRDVLDKISNSSTSTHAISQLLQNPALDCALLEQAARNLLAAPTDSAARVLTQVEELRPKLCAQ
ncbi:MAG TPA: hypothetical protein VFH13_07215 [Gemmatimonadaceae bacterium]|nr:hypothetical protein [Gemmatimonadaceae bacterium]